MLRRMVDALMRREIRARLAVVMRFVSMNSALAGHVIAHDLADNLGVEPVHFDRPRAPAALPALAVPTSP